MTENEAREFVNKTTIHVNVNNESTKEFRASTKTYVNNERAKEFLNNTKIYVNGKSREIQEKLFSLGYGWFGTLKKVKHVDKPFLFIHETSEITSSEDMCFFKNHDYREITPEELFSIQIIGPLYTPFKSAEECLKEMSKHSPTGWVKYKDVDCSCNITSIHSGEINEIILSNIHNMSFKEAFKNLTFVDGEPFGIKKPSPWDKRILIY